MLPHFMKFAFSRVHSRDPTKKGYRMRANKAQIRQFFQEITLGILFLPAGKRTRPAAAGTTEAPQERKYPNAVI